MMSFHKKIILGKTGLSVGRLGISSSFGAPTQALEEAFEKGCNYFTWGAFIKGRSSQMRKAIINITASGRRDNLVIGMLTYAHNAFLTERFFLKGLKDAGLDHADVLLLGWFPKRPSQRILDGAMKLKGKGLVRHIGLTGHKRKLFPILAEEELFDVFHIRYNPTHRGAETDIFPHLKSDSRPGVVSFTATDWRKLLNPRKMPPGVKALSAGECYRFVLSHPAVDVCMMGAKNIEQMRDNLKVLDTGPMTEEELIRIRKIGDFVYGRKRT